MPRSADVHATAIVLGAAGVLIRGRSGAGKVDARPRARRSGRGGRPVRGLRRRRPGRARRPPAGGSSRMRRAPLPGWPSSPVAASSSSARSGGRDRARRRPGAGGRASPRMPDEADRTTVVEGVAVARLAVPSAPSRSRGCLVGAALGGARSANGSVEASLRCTLPLELATGLVKMGTARGPGVWTVLHR